MLVLGRKIGDRIIINQNITVEVVAIVGNQVRLGIVAPEEVRILRAELKPFLGDRHDGHEAA